MEGTLLGPDDRAKSVFFTLRSFGLDIDSRLHEAI
jgi:hypothetical protein